ncbi:hypothetical protein NKR19_g4034 [Coniochaeta hoffmannii]|uniref:Glycosyltransferase family 32 protein n=1 Tax=Coniochaeta hoffmannii TaxID=91930 RepID=A0AA38RUD6_9PEZI|nr:hypothetical protein NKR19_g4034 [Coniochaeta hoffmannii]
MAPGYTYTLVADTEAASLISRTKRKSPRLISLPHRQRVSLELCVILLAPSSTYDHRRLKTRDPVRSPIDKQTIARLVLGWVTTGESLVLYVFWIFCPWSTTFRALINPALKSDLLRYLLLSARGGTYSDVDTKPLVPLDLWLAPTLQKPTIPDY